MLKLNLLPLAQKTVESVNLSDTGFSTAASSGSVNMWQSDDSMRHLVDFVLTVALKGLGTVLVLALIRQHVQNALVVTLVFFILIRPRIVAVPTHRTIRIPRIKVTNLQLPPIPLVTRE